MDARVTLPAVLGHEMSGTIAAIGDGVGGWSVGERVTVMPLAPCGHVRRVARGIRTSATTSISWASTPQARCSRRWNVPQEVLVAVPAALSLEHGALAEPTAVAVHDVRRAGLRDGERAVVVGGGPIGLLVACVARAQ